MRKILGALRRADERFNLIEEGDEIAVALSGGRDSMVLLYALSLYGKFKKKDYTLRAITVDLGFGNFNTPLIAEYAASLHIPLDIISTDIAQIVFDIRKEKNPCALCAKMRKGALYERAVQLGCNKTAFAHHADDAIQTLIMSLLYEARMNTFAPRAYLSRRNITQIRPLITLRQSDIIEAADRNHIPIAKNPCPIDFATKREEAKEVLRYLEQIRPDAGDHILHALLHTESYHLWNILDGSKK